MPTWLLQEGEPSYKQFAEERDGILSSLKRRAVIMEEALNKLDGVTCNPAEGSLYVFPRIRLPKGAIDAAKEVHPAPAWPRLQESRGRSGDVMPFVRVPSVSR